MARTALLGVSILFALAPLGFGVIRAVRTDDVRYLWVSLASLVGAGIVFVVGKAATRMSTFVAVRAASVFIVATLFAVTAASLLGVRVYPGSLVVTSAFGFCYAAACGLYLVSRLSRRRKA